MKSFFFKICIVLIIVLIPLNFLGFYKGFSAKASGIVINNSFTVAITPNNAGKIAEYHLYGIIAVDSIDEIILKFRKDATFTFAHPMTESILVNEKAVSKVSIGSDEYYGVICRITLSEKLEKGEKIDILIKKEAGIRNPVSPGVCYKVVMQGILKSYIVFELESDKYIISVSSVDDVNVKVNPPTKGFNAGYNIRFITGVLGKMFSGDDGDSIFISFAEGTYVPQITKSSLRYVKINGYRVFDNSVKKVNSRTLEIAVNGDISPLSNVEIEISEEFGIINPKIAGKKTILVSTTAEPTFVESEPFEIFEPEIQNLSVSLVPDSIATEPEINISFKTSPVGHLLRGDKIYMEFPRGFYLEGINPSGGSFVNGKEADAFVQGNTLQIVAPEDILSSTVVEIKISESPHIKNPIIAGDYVVNVWTDSDSSRSPFSVSIKESFVSEVHLEALYSGSNSVNEFMIFFKNGPVYTLAQNVDSIILKFDDGFVLPDVPSQNLITVNGKVAPTVSREVYALYITTPLDILPLSTVEVKIPEEFGIKNPGELGEYGVKVSTSREPTEIESNKLKITPLPVVEFTINPQAPDGQNGYYKTNPEIMLSTSNGVKVFYKIDDGEFSEFAQTFKMPEGTHFLFVYAVDSSGNKGDIVKKEFAVDTTPPEVKFNNTNSNPVFRGSPGKLLGSVSEPCTLKINEVILELKDNLNFEVELNVYEGMPIAIYARDLAGNASTLLLTAHIDSIPPVITFLNSVAKLQGLNINSVETTESTYTVQVKLDEKGKVFIDSNEMYFDGDAYSYTANLIEGDNQFIIKAVDSAGNETVETLVVKKVNEKKIVLQIGSNLASVGSETIELEAAPFIEKGFTLVPLRFISEAFGALVDWNDALKVITINYRTLTIQLQVDSNVVLVGTEFKKLDVPPKIVNGRTFVPIRFISETFGAEVLWDSTTKTITITYKP